MIWVFIFTSKNRYAGMSVDLAKLMIEHSLGVQVKETIRVAKIDQDFFNGDE